MNNKGKLQRAFGYVRVSDSSQIEGHSLGAQRHAIKTYCQGHGYELVSVFEDAGISGRYDEINKRPAFKGMLEAVGRREADLVIVHSVDRFGRNVLVSMSAFKTLGDAGCAFVSLSEQIDYSTAGCRLFLTLLSSFAQYFSDALGKHSSKAKRARGRAGLPLAQVPFGYRHDSDRAVLVPEEATALRESVFQPFLTGRYDYKTLAASMNDAGWHTRSLNKMAEQRSRGEEPVGGPWKADTVLYVLQNAFYVGFVTDSVEGKSVKGEHTPILSEEDFNRIQAIIGERRESRTPYPSQVQRRPDKFREYELRGLLKFAVCGTPMAGVTRTAKGKDFRYYIFYCAKRGETCQATTGRQTHAINATKLEFDSQDVADALAALKDADVEAMLLPADELQRRHREINSLNERKRRVRLIFEMGDYTAAEYAKRMVEINAEIRRLTPQADVALERAKALLTNLREFPWLTASAEGRAGLLQQIFEALFVDPETGRIVAVSPRAEFRPFLKERAWIKREATGWTVLPNGDRDLEHPDDWAIQFVETAEEALEPIVSMERGTGLEPATTCLEGRSSTS